MRVSRVRALSGFSKVLINAVRGIPILVQLFYIYFVFPEIGIQLSAFEASVIGPGFGYPCYMGEVVRARIEAEDPGAVAAGPSPRSGRLRIFLPRSFPTAF